MNEQFYKDLFRITQDAPDYSVGQAIKSILGYINSSPIIEPTDASAKVIYYYAKLQIDYYKQKKESLTEKRKKAGKMGGRPKIKKIVERKNLVKIQLSLDSVPNEFKSIFKIWYDYKSKRKPYKQQCEVDAACKRLINLSDNNTDNALEIIENAMSGSYQNFFALKSNIQKYKNNAIQSNYSTNESIVDKAKENIDRIFGSK
jgi:hypothetical protein